MSKQKEITVPERVELDYLRRLVREPTDPILERDKEAHKVAEAMCAAHCFRDAVYDWALEHLETKAQIEFFRDIAKRAADKRVECLKENLTDIVPGKPVKVPPKKAKAKT